MPVHEEMLELKIDTKSIAEANKLNRNKHKGRLRTGAAWEGMVALLAEVEETATEQIGVLAETAAAKKAAAAEAKKAAEAAEETRKRKMDEEAVSKKKPASGTANRKTPASEVSEAAAEKVAEEAAFTQALSLFSPEIPPSEMENLPRIVEEDSAASAKTKRTNLLAIVKRLRQEAKVTTAREQEQLVGERERLAREQERLARERERLAEVTAFRKTRASVTAEMIAAGVIVPIIEDGDTVDAIKEKHASLTAGIVGAAVASEAELAKKKVDDAAALVAKRKAANASIAMLQRLDPATVTDAVVQKYTATDADGPEGIDQKMVEFEGFVQRATVCPPLLAARDLMPRCLSTSRKCTHNPRCVWRAGGCRCRESRLGSQRRGDTGATGGSGRDRCRERKISAHGRRGPEENGKSDGRAESGDGDSASAGAQPSGRNSTRG